MTDRERLIEILKLGSCPSPYLCDENCKYANLERCYEERTADLLLEHGVIVLPCKVGDTLYCESAIKGHITYLKAPDLEWIFENREIFEKEIFPTREEAERALNERENNG